VNERNAKFNPMLEYMLPDPVEQELEQRRIRERRQAEAQAFHAVAYLSMPEDLKESAKAWGVSAIMEAVWMNAFECGYKQANRDRAALTAKDGETP